MKRFPVLILVILMGLLTPLAAQARTHSLFYLLRSRASVESFEAHKSQIDILVPAWYQVDATGLVAGEPDPVVLRDARAAGIPVIPLLALSNQKWLHALLHSPAAQAVMNAGMLRAARKNGYAGFQIDFEDISWTDRNALSAMVKNTAEAMHRAGLQLEIATVPNAPGHPGETNFSRWMFTNWRGAYDLKALAQSADLICLMTYDQHTKWTVPGPVAGWQWTIENLNYALQFVPKSKLALGIPLYGYHWYTGDPGFGSEHASPHPTASSISGPNALFLLRTYHGHQEWDPVDHATDFWFYRDQMREWVFYTDQRTFAARYDLASQHGVWGICSWVLGLEDPAIWTVIPARPKMTTR
uniref:Glycosyl hydrolase n=1 Tax=Acidobacterium capsulatum TaxID=33075 RepID=A0A7V4XRH2_9BACT